MHLGKDEIHIWRIADQGPCVDIDRLSRFLTSAEWTRHNEFVFEADRRQFLITRAMLREVLSKYRPEIAPLSWRFEVNGFGKPRVDAGQSGECLYFNLSHTPGAIFLAVGGTPQIGIDTEHTDRNLRDLSLFDTVLTDREIADTRAQPKSQQALRFYTYWTLKEAYIKAIGKGLSIPLHGFGFDLCCGDHPKLYLCGHSDPDSKHWHFRSWSEGSGHIVALAFNSSETDIAVNIRTFA